MQNEFQKSGLFNGAKSIVLKLRAKGFQALFAGGCVRDVVMGRMPKDIDIVTDAVPDQVLKLFPRSVAVGKAFGVVRVGAADVYYDVATYRADGVYHDGRHPGSVAFADEKTDARRRDFTINAVFYDPVDGKFKDHVGGLADIERKIIRTVGNPNDRFQEDHLRMLRAVRFAATLNFSVEPETAAAIKRHATLISKVSAERIQQELSRILVEAQKAGDAFVMLSSYGLLKEILPEVEEMRGQEQPPQFHPEGDVWTHTILMLNAMHSPSLRLAYAVLLHDVGKPPTAVQAPDRIRFNRHASYGAGMASKIMERLRLPSADIKAVSHIIGDHMRFMDVRRMRRSTLRRLITSETFPDELELHRLDCEASHGDLENYMFLVRLQKEYEAEPVLPPPFITGHDIIKLGISAGPRVGELKKAAYDAQLEGKFDGRAGALKWLTNRVKTAVGCK
jgi:poly(A) polymerase